MNKNTIDEVWDLLRGRSYKYTYYHQQTYFGKTINSTELRLTIIVYDCRFNLNSFIAEIRAMEHCTHVSEKCIVWATLRLHPTSTESWVTDYTPAMANKN